MDKEKLIKGGVWLAGFSLSVFLCAISIYIGNNNYRKSDNYTLLIIGYTLIPFIYFLLIKVFRLF